MDRFFGWRKRREKWSREGKQAMTQATEVIPGKLVRLRTKQIEDAAADYAWRRDAELSSFDAVSPTTLSFEEFLRDYRYEL